MLWKLTFIWMAVGVFLWLWPPVHRIRVGTRRKDLVHWFELRPKGGRVMTVETVGPAVSSAMKPLEHKRGTFRWAGCVGVRMIDGGQFRSLIGVWGVGEREAGTVANGLVAGIGGIADPLVTGPVLPEGVIALAALDTHDTFATGRVSDPTQASGFLAEVMGQTGGDSALVFTFEPISTWESAHKRQWINVEQRASEGQHGSIGTMAALTAQQAGSKTFRVRAVGIAPTDGEAGLIATGFADHLVDMGQKLHAKRVCDWLRVRPLTWSMIGWGAMFLLLTQSWVTFGLFVAAGLVLGAVGHLGIVNMTARELTVNLRNNGLLVAHRPRKDNPRKVLEGFFRSLRDRDSTDAATFTPGARASNPHPRELFLLDSVQLGSMIGFPGSHASVEAASSIERDAPASVKHGNGLRLGLDSEGDTVWFDEPDLYSNLIAFGEPGSGKSTVIQGLWWSALLRREEAKRQGRFPGVHLAIETKGDGAVRYVTNAARAQAQGVGLMVASAPSGPRLDLVRWNEPARAAQLLVEALKYVFSDQAIQDQASAVIRSSLHVAIAMPAELARTLGWEGGRPNVMKVAYWLTGGDVATGTTQRVRALCYQYATTNQPAADPNGGGEGLAAVVDPKADGHVTFADTEFGRAFREFARFLPPHVTQSKSDDLMMSSKNKFEAVLVADAFWEPTPNRPEFTFDQVLSQGGAIVLNLGPPGPGIPGYTRELSQRLGGITLVCLWDAIRSTCAGWQLSDKHIHIFSDELRDLAGVGNQTVNDIIGEMSDQGRSFGVRMFLASQRPTQLPAAPREAVLGFGCRIYFRQDEVDTAEAVAKDLDNTYTPQEIRALDNLTGTCRIRVNGVAQPVFTLKPVLDPDLDPRHHSTANLTGTGDYAHQ